MPQMRNKLLCSAAMRWTHMGDAGTDDGGATHKAPQRGPRGFEHGKPARSEAIDLAEAFRVDAETLKIARVRRTMIAGRGRSRNDTAENVEKAEQPSGEDATGHGNTYFFC